MNDSEIVKRLRRRLPSRNERRITYALKVLALVGISIYLLVGVLQFFAAIRATGLLLVGAVFLAYFVYPLVRRLNDRLPLIWSLLIVYLFVFIIAGSAIALVAPALANDIQTFGKAIPDLVARLQHELSSPTNPLLRRVPLEDRMYLASVPTQIAGMIQTNGLDTLQKGVTVLLSAFSVIGSVVIVPVLAAYLLLDAENLRRQLIGLFPERAHQRVSAIVDDLDGVVGGFIRGQLIDGAIVGAMIFVMLLIMHVPYALLIGVCAGILNFIPYAGAIIGFVPSVILAAAYNGPGNAAIVAVLFAVIQQIDGNFVAPRVLKDNVGLSPVYIIIAILAGSELFGLAGTFLAVPVAAMLRVMREHFVPSPVFVTEAPPELTPAPRRRTIVKKP